jgi:hypothetical protein
MWWVPREARDEVRALVTGSPNARTWRELDGYLDKWVARETRALTRLPLVFTTPDDREIALFWALGEPLTGIDVKHVVPWYEHVTLWMSTGTGNPCVAYDKAGHAVGCVMPMHLDTSNRWVHSLQDIMDKGVTA